MRIFHLLNIALLFLGASRLLNASNPSLVIDDSFRGLPYGASLADAAAKKWELTPVNDANGDNPKFQVYVRTDEQKSLGDMTLQEITYYFLNGKFYGVLILTADGNQTQILKHALISSRGNPYSASSPAGALVWIGTSSTAILKRNQETGEGTMMIVGNGLQESYESYVKSAGDKVGKDL
jgi:hypothetical protein